MMEISPKELDNAIRTIGKGMTVEELESEILRQRQEAKKPKRKRRKRANSN
jgi:hypothetical protein